ncbi:unnamed protein product [Candida verbasci]|uniref:ENTH domain-containing protein n=1 Tax=Candida verbasci TaxID=1227364 RepID=A0A9W4TTG6_9ASCO|nr:unnamed protein product [Candida verbasci]
MSKIVRSIKNVAGGYPSTQVLVRNATSNDPTGPTTFDMEDIASYTYQSQTKFMEVMDMLDRRLNDKGKNWRHVAKSLTVLDYLVRYGSEKCVLWAKDNIYIVKTLREFIHLDEYNNDQGAIIRVKAKELVSLLRDDERLRQERASARRGRRGGKNNEFDDDESNGGDNEEDFENRRNRRRRERNRDQDEPYDADLQRALELSRITAEEETNRNRQEENDPDLEAAIKLSLEEEEMRKQNNNDNNNLLDLNDQQQQQQQQQQPQFYLATGYYQQPQYYQQQQQQPFQQYDMFGNPIQNPMETGVFDQQQYYQQQQAQQSQPNQFTGFNYGQPQSQQQQQPLQPLKTGSNNPFALNSNDSKPQPQSSQTLNNLAQQRQETQQPQFFTQPTQVQQYPTTPLKAQNTSGSRFNESHELNDLLTQGTGLDTFGNTGATRIPHQHTKTQNFINSSGTGYRQQTGDQGHRISSNATGNPFLNTGISYQQQQQQQQQAINAAYTGYGFGNQQQQPQQQRNGNDGPSLIDI